MSAILPATSVARQLANEGVAYPSEIASAASRHSLDPKLLAAIAAQETGGPGTNAGRNIVGDGGHGRGLFQIDDRYHGFARSAAAMDPAQNADYAAAMIAGLLHSYGGDVRKALSAYNAGSPNATGTITEWIDGRRLGYADSVLRHCAQLGEPAPSGVAGSTDTPMPNFEQSAVNQIMQDIAQMDALRSFNQSSSPDTAAFSPSLSCATLPSYAQLSGLDAYGHSRYAVSYAGLLTGDDSL